MKDILKDYKRILLPLVAIAVVVFILEYVVFSFRHWQFIKNTPVTIDNWQTSGNVSSIDTNAFRVDSTDEKPYIEVTGIDMDINLFYFDFINIDKGETGVLEFDYTLELTDQGNSLPYKLPQRTFFRHVTKSHYAPVNPYGRVKSVRLYFDNVSEGDMIRVCSFIINPEYTLQISKKRMIVMFFFLLMIFCIRPGSPLYGIKVCGKSKAKMAVVLCLLLAEIFVFYKAIHLDKWFDNVPEGGCTQFMQLTEAIVDRGEVFLAAKAPEGMADMEDPYDAVLRRSLYGEESDVGDMSDTGFYKGRYFVYFGIAPIIIFYVPFYMITGTHIATRTVVFILCALNAMAVLFLLYELCKKYFKELPFVLYLMSSVLFTFGAGQLFLTRSPDFYSVPIHFALTCTLAGLGCFIKALNIIEDSVVTKIGAEMSGNSNNVVREESKLPGKVNAAVTALYAVGALFMALTAASRPQFLIASFLTIVLFWNEVFKSRRLLSLKSIGKTVAFVLPYVLVAAGIMYYNYIRFGNVFDFGANYNLCYNNMPYRGVHIDRLFHATVGYLFYPCSVINRFPFFELSNYTSRYMGITADETLFGGIIYNNLYLAIVFFIFAIKKCIKKMDAMLLAFICPVFSLIVAVTDANMAGVLPRYYADFTWGFMISAFILLGYLYVSGGIGLKENNLSEDVKVYRTMRVQYITRAVFAVLFVWTIIRLFLMMFYGDTMHNNNMMTYNIVKNLVEFWY